MCSLRAVQGRDRDKGHGSIGLCTAMSLCMTTATDVHCIGNPTPAMRRMSCSQAKHGTPGCHPCPRSDRPKQGTGSNSDPFPPLRGDGSGSGLPPAHEQSQAELDVPPVHGTHSEPKVHCPNIAGCVGSERASYAFFPPCVDYG
eukprot:5976078-Amphidinium_carterae.1